MKILFLYPELQLFRHKPIGTSIMLGILRRDDHQVEFFNSSLYNQDRVLPDTSMREKELMPPYWFKKPKRPLALPGTLGQDVIDALNRKLDEFEPEVILVSTTYLSFPLGVKIINLSRAKKNLVIYGGIHCTIAPEEAISHHNVKYVHLGESEKSLPIIMEKIENKESIDGCDNLWVKQEDGHIRKNKLSDLIDNMDELPFYNWDGLNEYYYLKLFLGEPYRFGDYSTSRGCYNRCSYCFHKNFYDTYCISNRTVRRYSVDRMIEELIYLKGRYDLTFIKFHDSDFLNMRTSELDKFSSQYRKHINLPNSLNACIERVNENKAKYLIRMNCQSISVGLESGNEEIRDRLLNRHYSNRFFIKKIGVLQDVGLRVSTPNLLGLPGETRKNMLETIRLNRDAKIDYADFNIFYPFPKLRLTEYAIEKGYLKRDANIRHYIFGIESPLKSSMTKEQLRNIYRSATLYAKLPILLWPLIRYAERHNTDNGMIWVFLRGIYFFKLQYLNFSVFLRRRKRKKCNTF